MKLTPRMKDASLLQFANFKDGTFVNLTKMNKPYSTGERYIVTTNSKSIFTSDGLFKCHEQASEKFKLMKRNILKTECKVITSEGILGYS